MQDLTSNYAKWISGFTKEQFDIVVETYLREIWKISDLTITDGTNDGGNDIRIFKDNNKLKIQIQVTIQKADIEGKITKELKNAKNNVAKYNYEKKLYFFYSYSISEEKINELETDAEVNYGIQLKVFDAKRIASGTKSSEKLLQAIHAQYGLTPTPTVLSNEDKMLYDFISFGSNAMEIKNQIVKAYVVHKLYENGEVEKDALQKCCNDHFGNNDNIFFSKLISKLKSNSIKEIKKDGKIVYTLTEKEKDRINLLKSQFNFHEQKLNQDIKGALYKHHISFGTLPMVIEKLRELFESNFDIDKQEILDKAYSLNADDKMNAFNYFIKGIKKVTGITNVKTKELAKDLIAICRENDILQRLSAGKLFASFSDPEVIRNYVNQQNRMVFCDTRIALYALCIYYEDVSYTDKYYESVQDFLRVKNKYDGLQYKFYWRYIDEVAYHIKEALQLIPYEELNLFNELGGTSNIFFNYFIYLKEHDFLEEGVNTFGDFMHKFFEIEEGDANRKNFTDFVYAVIAERLESMGVAIFDEDLNQEFYSDAKRIIQECQIARDKFRPETTIKNDARMLSILFDPETSINEPVFITWDQTIFDARKRFHQQFKASRLWHYFTPNQFVSHISILNFNINSQTITREVLSIMDDSFNLYKKTHNLLDTISKLLNVRTDTGRRYIEKIKEFKKEHVYEVDNADRTAGVESDKELPIEKILLKLAHNYSTKGQLYTLDDFKYLFTVGALFDKVVDFFLKQLTNLRLHNDFTADAVSNMDKLIAEALEIKKSTTST